MWFLEKPTEIVANNFKKFSDNEAHYSPDIYSEWQRDAVDEYTKNSDGYF